MARLAPVLIIAAFTAAVTPALAEPPAPAGQKVLRIPVCDRGAFRRGAWNRDFGRVEFVRPDRPLGSLEERADPKVRCITERNLARLKARQSATLQVIDPR